MNRVFFSPILVLALTVPPTPVWAQQPRSDYHGPHMMWESGWMFFGPLMMVAFIAVIVVVVVLLLRWLSDHRPGSRTASESKAIDILKERYARGEIDKEEYEERRQTLRD